MVCSAHSLIDWAIATGRAPLDSRAALLVEYAADPVACVGELLTTPPTREGHRPCPLFATSARATEVARRGHQTRQRRAASIATETEKLIDGVLGQLGHDREDPGVRTAVAAALRELQTQQAALRRRRAKAEMQRERRRLSQARLSPMARLAEKWRLPEEETPEEVVNARYSDEMWTALEGGRA